MEIIGSNPSPPPFIKGRKIIPLSPPGQLPARRALQLGERPLWVGDQRGIKTPVTEGILIFYSGSCGGDFIPIPEPYGVQGSGMNDYETSGL